jgi:hypothetical protein
MNLRLDYPHEVASLTLAVLTIQFIPIEYREKLMQQIAANTSLGDGF